MRKLFFVILLLFYASTVFGQNYPVQSSVQLNKPYSLFLSDYTAIGSNKMSVNLWLKDLAKPVLTAKLRLKIEGLNNSIRITSNNYGNYPQLVLESGSPQLLSDSDLQPYFEVRNLNFERGLTQQAFLRTGKLPEGLYRFTIEVLDYFTGRQVSNAGSAIAWMMLNDPPMLNFPADHHEVTQIDPLLITFQWTPRHTASPNAVMGVEYTLELVELRNAQHRQNPAMAFLSAQRFYTVTTFNTTYIYGLSDLPLEAGMHYAWRVRASTEDGADLFKNQGWSEARSFQFGQSCQPVTYLTAEVEGTHAVALEWMDEITHTEFVVEYRIKDSANPNAPWTAERTNQPYLRLKKLEEGTTYEFRVKGLCMGEETDYTETVEAETMEEVEREFVCGAEQVPFNLELQELIPSLNTGDIIWANDFDIELTEVYKESEGFSGEGLMVLPMMNHAKVGVEFDNIKVNPEMRMYVGQIYLTGVSVQPFSDDFYDEYGDYLGAFTDAYSFMKGSGDLYEQFKDFIPEDVGQNIEDKRTGVDEAKEEYKEAKQEKRDAKRAAKEIERAEDEGTQPSQEALSAPSVEEAKQQVADAKKAKQEANKALVDAYMEGLKAVTTELKKVVKDLAEYSSSVAAVISTAPGPLRQQKESEALASGKKIMDFLKKLDGKDAPERSLPDLNNIPKKYLDKINEINALAGIEEDILEMGNSKIAELPQLAQLQMVLGTIMQGKSMIEKGLPTDVSTSIEFVRQSISLLNMALETAGGFINDEGEVKDAEGWSETDWITFQNVEGELGFDHAVLSHPEMGPYYTKIDFGEGKEPYWVPWKAVPKDGTGFVKLVWSKGTPNWSKLSAKDEDGNEVSISSSQTIQVNSSSRKKYYQLFLDEGTGGEPKIVGELNVRGYKPEAKQVYIVKLNGEDRYLPSEAELEERLNEIYGVANVSWEVKPYEDLSLDNWDEDNDGKIDDGQTDELATYTPEMKNIIKAYRNINRPRGDEFVLFWVGSPASGNLDGYMPLSKRYGFIFSSQLGSKENAKRTTAHELGHGAFRLDHTWNVFENIAQGQSQNLMDYNGGSELWKWQWDLIHNPVPMIGFEQNEEEGQSIADREDYIIRIMESIRCGWVSTSDVLIDDWETLQTDGVLLTDITLANGTDLSSVRLKNGAIGASNDSSGDFLMTPQSPTIEESGLYGFKIRYVAKDNRFIEFQSFTKSAVEKLLAYLTPEITDWENNIASRISEMDALLIKAELTDNESDDLKMLVLQTGCALNQIEDVDLRFRLFKFLAHNKGTNWFGYGMEKEMGKIFLDLVTTIPNQTQRGEFYKKLNEDNSGIFRSLLFGWSSMTGDLLKEFHKELAILFNEGNKETLIGELDIFEHTLSEEVYEKLVEQNDYSTIKLLAENNIFLWSDPGLFKFIFSTDGNSVDYDEFNINDNGEISFNIDHVTLGQDYDFSVPINGAKLKPFEPILVLYLTNTSDFFQVDKNLASQPIYRGGFLMLPAINMQLLDENKMNSQLSRGFDAATFVIPFGLFAKAGRWGLAAYETGLFLLQQGFNDYQTDLQTTETGRAVLRAWMITNIVISIAELKGDPSEIFGSLKNLKSKIQKLPTTGKLGKFRESQLSSLENDLLKLEKSVGADLATLEISELLENTASNILSASELSKFKNQFKNSDGLRSIFKNDHTSELTEDLRTWQKAQDLPTEQIADYFDQLQKLDKQLGASKADISAIVNRFESNYDRIDQITTKLATYVKATEGKAGALALMTKLPTNKLDEVLAGIESLTPSNYRTEFLKDVTRTPGNIDNNLKDYIIDNLDKLEGKHIETWFSVKQSFRDKATSFKFLNENVGKTIEEIADANKAGDVSIVKVLEGLDDGADLKTQLRQILKHSGGEDVANLIDADKLRGMGVDPQEMLRVVSQYEGKLALVDYNKKVSSIRDEFVKELNVALGKGIPSGNGTFGKLMNSIYSNGSIKGAIGEAYVKHHKLGAPSMAATGVDKIQFDGAIRDALGLTKKRSPDGFWLEVSGNQLVIYDVKVGSSFDVEQLVDYGKIVEAMTKEGTRKYDKMKEFLSTKGISLDDMDDIEMKYIVLDGGQGGISTAVNKISNAKSTHPEIDNTVKKIITVEGYE
ncbi:hypothetical protein [Sediminitomix flava]|uniref:Fibronectin type-III domain-containing protein n=1 Tax=Sediminitomix flava TaxID=379075 RepID=A0A315ZBG0_SEDFL|nr:hypothetical protein [Sediminitomix flava]PWJ42700.1 hypothetical protein BC781_102245 [Sediminitomix flava]